MRNFLRLLANLLASMVKPRARLEAENIVLRHPLNVLRRVAPKADLEAHLRCPHIDRFRARAGELLAEPPGITLWTQISSARLRRFSPLSSMLRHKAFGAFYRFGSPAEAAKQCRAAVDAVSSERLRRSGELDPLSGEFFRPSP